MNRGILALGITTVIITLGSAFASIFVAILSCFDTCPPVFSVARNPAQTLLLQFMFLAPAVIMALVVWIWQIIELRRMGERNTLIAVATFPALALVAIVVITALATVSSGRAALAFTPLDLWTGKFGLALWPLLISIVAFIKRSRPARLA